MASKETSGPHRKGLAWSTLFHLAATVVFFFTWLLRRTCRIKIKDDSKAVPNAIYCVWHSDYLPYFMVFTGKHRLAFMISNSWKVTFLRICGFWLGIEEYIFGASGDGGRRAAEQVIDRLRGGLSTLITPDGPRGPARRIKRGVLHMALASGVPIVVVNFEPGVRFPVPGTWDEKWLPVPFSRLKIRLHEPLFVKSEDDFARAEEALYARLNSSAAD